MKKSAELLSIEHEREHQDDETWSYSPAFLAGFWSAIDMLKEQGRIKNREAVSYLEDRAEEDDPILHKV